MNNCSGRRLRVLYFANHLRGPDLPGGARSWHQAKGLSRVADVTAVVPKFDPLTASLLVADPFPGVDSFQLKRAPSTPPRRSSKWGRALYHTSCIVGQAIAALRSERPDVVISMYAPATTAVIPTLTAKLLGIPHLIDVRDIPVETALEIGYLREGLVSSALRILDSGVLGAADRILVVSQEMIPFLEAKGACPARISLAPIGYDDFPEPKPDDVSKERLELLESFGSRPRTLALYSGTVGHILDLESVMDAANLLRHRKDIGFVICGTGQRLDEHRRRAVDQALNVRFLGRVPKSRVHRVCRAVDLCLFPITGGAAIGAMLGNKIFDYMGAAKCVLYTGPEGAVSSLIADSGCGVVLGQGDAVGLADAIKDLCERPEELRRLGVLGRSYVLKRMTAEMSVAVLLDVLGKIAPSRPGTAGNR